MKRKKIIILIILPLLLSFIIYKKIGGQRINRELSTLERQEILEKNFLSDASAYTLENPKVILNPYETAPLSALVIFSTDRAEEASVALYNKEGSIDLTYDLPSSKYHYIPLVGLYPNYNNKVVIRAGELTKELKIKTASISGRNNKILNNYNNEVLLIDNFATPIIYDKAGNLRSLINIPVAGDYYYKNGMYFRTKLSKETGIPIFYKINLLGKIEELVVLDNKNKSSENQYLFDVKNDIPVISTSYKVTGEFPVTKTKNKKISLFKTSRYNKKYSISHNKFYLNIKLLEDADIILDNFIDRRVYPATKGNNYIFNEGIIGTYKVYLYKDNKVYDLNKTVKFVENKK